MNYRPTFTATVQTVGLYAAGFIIPVVGQVLALITPVPLILVSLRNGRKEGFVALGASAALIAVLGGWQAAAILLFTFGLMSVGIAEGMRRQMKPEQVSLLGGLLPVAVIGLAVAFYFFRVGKSPVGAIEDYLRTSLAEAAALYTKMGLNDMAATVTSVSDTFVHYLVRLIPAITIATSVTQAATCYSFSRAVIIRKDPASPTRKPTLSLIMACAGHLGVGIDSGPRAPRRPQRDFTAHWLEPRHSLCCCVFGPGHCHRRILSQKSAYQAVRSRFDPRPHPGHAVFGVCHCPRHRGYMGGRPQSTRTCCKGLSSARPVFSSFSRRRSFPINMFNRKKSFFRLSTAYALNLLMATGRPDGAWLSPHNPCLLPFLFFSLFTLFCYNVREVV